MEISMQLRSTLLVTTTAGLLVASLAFAQTTSPGGTANTSGPSSGATTGGTSGGTMGSSTGGTPGLPGSQTVAPDTRTMPHPPAATGQTGTTGSNQSRQVAPAPGQQAGRSTPACPEGRTASGRRVDDSTAGCVDTGPGAFGTRR
jgi:hypothetical protein